MEQLELKPPPSDRLEADVEELVIRLSKDDGYDVVNFLHRLIIKIRTMRFCKKHS